MKILMLTPYLPYPPSSGGQIRSYNLIKELSKKHKITLYSLIKYDDEKKHIKELEKYCHLVKVFKRPTKPWTIRNILRTGFSLLPFLAIRNFSYEEKKDLVKLLKKETFDIIHAETFYVCPHIPKTQTPLVVVDQTMEYQVYQHFAQQFKILPLRPVLMLDVAKIKFWETYYWKKATRVVAVSEKDGAVMKQFVPAKKVSIVSNPVGEDLMLNVKPHYSQKILFMGNYDWLQNVEAAQLLVRELFPMIKKHLPDASLVIAGQNIHKLGHLEGGDIKVQGLAIDDTEGVVRSYHSCGMMLAPMYGPAGGRVKIIGAMAARLPVVTTDIGIQGIDKAINGKNVLFSKTAEELVAQAVRLLTDKTLYTKIANSARELAETEYSPQATALKMDKVYVEAINEAHG